MAINFMKKRQENILKAVVKDYIIQAEPVGSKGICNKYNLGISSATVRNELANLEEQGYLIQPHTSAGRVPTDKGYRFYVDYLMQEESLNKNEAELIRNEYQKVTKSVKDVLIRTLHVSSLVTNYATIVLAPKLFSEVLKFIHMVLVGVDKALVVLMINTGMTCDFLVDIENEIKQDDLDRISNLLNEKLKGHDLSELDGKVIREVIAELPLYNDILSRVFESLKQVENQLMRKSEVYHKGISEMIKLPEFKNFETMQSVIKILEEDKVLINIFERFLNSEKFAIRIGKENQIRELQECSVLAKTYKAKSNRKGVVGLLGPRRMRYAHMKAVLDNISENISGILDEEVALSIHDE